jgi:hypothetical protein
VEVMHGGPAVEDFSAVRAWPSLRADVRDIDLRGKMTIVTGAGRCRTLS